MKVSVLGSGDVGKSLASAFIALNHDVMLGAREEGNPAAAQWAKSAGPTAELVKDFGWESADIGGIEASHYLEAMCLVWVSNAMKNNAFNRVFKLLPTA
jgi:predicted dinucleotide-binding enzyme